MVMHVLHTVPGVAAALFGASLVELYGPGSPPQPIYVNRDQVVSVREPRSRADFSAGTRCVVTMSNGNLISSSEPCDIVLRRLR